MHVYMSHVYVGIPGTLYKYTCCSAFPITLPNKIPPIWSVLNPSSYTFKFHHRPSTASIAGPKRINPNNFVYLTPPRAYSSLRGSCNHYLLVFFVQGVQSAIGKTRNAIGSASEQRRSLERPLTVKRCVCVSDCACWYLCVCLCV